jgi:hypothetical protein
MLVVPFETKNGINKPFAKTNRLLGYCLQTHPGGPFFEGKRVMGEKTIDHGWGGHLTWSSPPLFMVN